MKNVNIGKEKYYDFIVGDIFDMVIIGNDKIVFPWSMKNDEWSFAETGFEFRYDEVDGISPYVSVGNSNTFDSFDVDLFDVFIRERYGVRDGEFESIWSLLKERIKNVVE